MFKNYSSWNQPCAVVVIWWWLSSALAITPWFPGTSCSPGTFPKMAPPCCCCCSLCRTWTCAFSTPMCTYTILKSWPCFSRPPDKPRVLLRSSFISSSFRTWFEVVRHGIEWSREALRTGTGTWQTVWTTELPLSTDISWIPLRNSIKVVLFALGDDGGEAGKSSL